MKNLGDYADGKWWDDKILGKRKPKTGNYFNYRLKRPRQENQKFYVLEKTRYGNFVSIADFTAEDPAIDFLVYCAEK